MSSVASCSAARSSAVPWTWTGASVRASSARRPRIRAAPEIAPIRSSASIAAVNRTPTSPSSASVVDHWARASFDMARARSLPLLEHVRGAVVVAVGVAEQLRVHAHQVGVARDPRRAVVAAPQRAGVAAIIDLGLDGVVVLDRDDPPLADPVHLVHRAAEV